MTEAGTSETERIVLRWVERLRREYPQVVAIVLKGSHARGNPGPHSDVDVDVLVDGPPCSIYPVHFEETTSGNLRHISIAVSDLAGWLAEETEPEEWAFGLPVREPTRLLWAASPELGDRLDRPWKPHPPAEPELEDFIESFGKAANALHSEDELGLRQAAQGIARHAATLLRPLHPDAVADSPRSALDAALAFHAVPDGYRDDMLTSLGLTDSGTSEAVFSAARRLATGVLATVQAHVDVIAPLLPEDLAALLRDGTFGRYLRQIAAGSEADT